jgi:hypothetical protein
VRKVFQNKHTVHTIARSSILLRKIDAQRAQSGQSVALSLVVYPLRPPHCTKLASLWAACCPHTAKLL